LMIFFANFWKFLFCYLSFFIFIFNKVSFCGKLFGKSGLYCIL
jgi:hypothetical protein